MSWQVWLSKNYAVISMWSKRWHKEECGELMSLMSIYLEKNWSIFSNIPDDVQRIKFLQTWMKNNVKWTNSEFSNNIRVNNFSESFTIVDKSEAQHLEILAENTSEYLKEYIIEITSDFGEEGARKILAVKSVYNGLPTDLKVLYDLYITKNLSLRDIANLLNIPTSSVYNMVKVLKKEIRLRCGI